MKERHIKIDKYFGWWCLCRLLDDIVSGVCVNPDAWLEHISRLECVPLNKEERERRLKRKKLNT
jgi:hypothetical protein